MKKGKRVKWFVHISSFRSPLITFSSVILQITIIHENFFQRFLYVTSFDFMNNAMARNWLPRTRALFVMCVHICFFALLEFFRN